MVSNWQPAHNLVEHAVSEAEITAVPCLLVLLSHTCLCFRGGRTLNGSSLALLWYSLGHNPLFCEHPRHLHVALESLQERSFFVFWSLTIPWFGLLCHISSLRLSSRHSSLVLTLRKDDAAWASLSGPHSVVVDASI